MSEHEYSQGICADGAAIMKDGQPMTPEQIVTELKEAQAARAQGDLSGKFRAEIRTERDPSDEYISYLTFVSDGKSNPYLHIPETLDQTVLDEALRRLNYHPPSGANQGGVPEEAYAEAATVINEVFSVSQHCECPSFWLAKEWREKTHGGDVWLTTSPNKPEQEWVRCEPDLMWDADSPEESCAEDAFEFANDRAADMPADETMVVNVMCAKILPSRKMKIWVDENDDVQWEWIESPQLPQEQREGE